MRPEHPPKHTVSRRRQHARATASDVARLAGVSTMTVSRVVNGEANVSEATRNSVRAAIDKLSYQPNKAARSLASANAVQVGIIYTNPSSPYLSAMLFGVLEQARRSDTQVVIAESAEGPDALHLIRSLARSGVDGVLLIPPLADDVAVLELLRSLNVEYVTMGSRPDLQDTNSVGIDEAAAARTMTRHLLELGHRRIGFIIGSPSHYSATMRLNGYREALDDAGVPVDEALLVQGDYSYRSGMEAAERLLQLVPRPTAIFASNDDMAAATVATAHRYNIEIPQELTICGFDDTLLATTLWPELTTIHQPIADMSQAALERLEQLVRTRRAGVQLDPEHLLLESSLVRRQSDAPPFS